jgi:ParB/RepB/Spo0J family partition protein
MSLTQPAPADVSALIGSTSLIRLALIDPSPFNPRKEFDAGEIKELADSIKAQGLLENLVVRPKAGGRFELMGGERRFRALKAIAAPEAKCNVIAADDAQAMAVQIVENLQRRDLGPLEEAEAFARLQRQDPKKWTAQEIAKAVGKTDRFVQQRLAIATGLSTKGKKLVAEGKLKVETARTLAAAPASMQDQILQNSWRIENLTADDVRRDLSRHAVPLAAAAFDTKLYDGPWIEEDGARMFADLALFEKLQTAAAKARVETLKAEWPDAAVHPGTALHNWVWADTGENLSWNSNRKGGKATGKLKVAKDKVTALVWIDSHTKRLVVCEGVCKATLLEKKTRSGGTLGGGGRKPETETHKAGRLTYSAALRAAAAKKPDIVKRMTAVILMIEAANGDTADEAINELKKTMPQILRPFIDNYFVDTSGALKAMAKLKPAELDSAIAQLAVAGLGWAEYHDKPEPHVAEFAAELGVKFVEPPPEPAKAEPAKAPAKPKAKAATKSKAKPKAKKAAAKKGGKK